MSKKPVPVFMFHTVGVPNKKWKWNYLTTPYDVFEDELIYLKKHGYSTIHLAELEEYIKFDAKIPDKSVILTFDDGYVDNYIFAYPLLKKHGLKGTIFVNPDFVDQRGLVRDRLDENSNVIEQNTTGFLSWEEMRIMEADGTIDIQSHALTHTWYPKSNTIIDFRHIGDEYWWMTWNDHPKMKPYLQVDNDDLIELGAPVYDNEKSLMTTRFFPDEKLKLALTSFVKLNGGLEFFKNDHWKQKLHEVTINFFKNNPKSTGRYETKEERIERITYELFESKRIIEQNLNKEIRYLCWPGGSGTSEGQLIAKELGYTMTTAARDLSRKERMLIKNNGNYYPDRIGRTSAIIHESIKKNGLHKVIYSNGIGLSLKIKVFNSLSYKRKFFAGILLLLGKLNSVIK
jgi:hypothetical protein